MEQRERKGASRTELFLFLSPLACLERCTKTSNDRFSNAFFAGQHAEVPSCIFKRRRSCHRSCPCLRSLLARKDKLLSLKLKLRLPFVLLGETLTGHIISVHLTRNELDCSHKCLRNPKCASFNFEIKQSRSLSTCELNNLSRMSSNNKLQSRDGFTYYEPLTLRERPKQEITAITPTTSNIIMTTVTTEEVSPTQAKAAIILSSVPSATQPATTAAPGKWFAKLKGTHSNLPPINWKLLVDFCWKLCCNCHFYDRRSLWLLRNVALVAFGVSTFKRPLVLFFARLVARKALHLAL